MPLNTRRPSLLLTLPDRGPHLAPSAGAPRSPHTPPPSSFSRRPAPLRRRGSSMSSLRSSFSEASVESSELDWTRDEDEQLERTCEEHVNDPTLTPYASTAPPPQLVHLLAKTAVASKTTSTEEWRHTLRSTRRRLHTFLKANAGPPAPSQRPALYSPYPVPSPRAHTGLQRLTGSTTPPAGASPANGLGEALGAGLQLSTPKAKAGPAARKTALYRQGSMDFLGKGALGAGAREMETVHELSNKLQSSSPTSHTTPRKPAASTAPSRNTPSHQTPRATGHPYLLRPSPSPSKHKSSSVTTSFAAPAPSSTAPSSLSAAAAAAAAAMPSPARALRRSTRSSERELQALGSPFDEQFAGVWGK